MSRLVYKIWERKQKYPAQYDERSDQIPATYVAIYDNIITTSKQLPSPNNPPLSLHCEDMMRKIKNNPIDQRIPT